MDRQWIIAIVIVVGVVGLEVLFHRSVRSVSQPEGVYYHLYNPLHDAMYHAEASYRVKMTEQDVRDFEHVYNQGRPSFAPLYPRNAIIEEHYDSYYKWTPYSTAYEVPDLIVVAYMREGPYPLSFFIPFVLV